VRRFLVDGRRRRVLRSHIDELDFRVPDYSELLVGTYISRLQSHALSLADVGLANLELRREADALGLEVAALNDDTEAQDDQPEQKFGVHEYAPRKMGLKITTLLSLQHPTKLRAEHARREASTGRRSASYRP